jgi:glycerol-3-phosphate acyltransferase PlsX
MRVAIDVMGGDNAPDAILKGCVEAIPLLGPEDQMVLIGPRDLIQEVLSERSVRDPRVLIEHAPDQIGMGEPPAKAVRSKPDSTIVRMALLGSAKAQNRCDAVISAGSTGACVTAAIVHMRRLRGVHRPGIAVTIPALVSPLVLCDAGANPEPRPTHLWQYGVMAETYARHTLKLAAPRVALMNIGAEEGKGTGIIKDAGELLAATPGLNFIGNIEGRDLFDGVADVVIADGFVGNTILKMAEGLSKSLFQAIAHEIFTIDPELGLQFEPVVKRIYSKNDYHEFGGAPLLGVNGIMMIAHGSSEAKTIRSAIRNTMSYARAGMNERLQRRIAEVAHIGGAEHAESV